MNVRKNGLLCLMMMMIHDVDGDSDHESPRTYLHMVGMLNFMSKT